ncbi:hypothetical protein Pfo_020460 [Paulownia fortunei]|nr:hypothetical protein Pfo_020460 [Paulownia fortunei]
MQGESSYKNLKRVGKKTDNERRTWTLWEEEVLITSLKDLISPGWKCENRFRTGYLGVLEKSILKIYVWKKKYGSLFSMLSRSNFGWNDAAHMIVVDSDEVWEKYVKMGVNARTMRFKLYIFYSSWCEIFGKDRATIEHVEDCSAAANEKLETTIPNEGYTCNNSQMSVDSFSLVHSMSRNKATNL